MIERRTESSHPFAALLAHAGFCAALGRTVLAASALELALRRHLQARRLEGVRTHAGLGELVRILKANDLLSEVGEMHFKDLVRRKSYLGNRLADLFAVEIAALADGEDALDERAVARFEDRAQWLADDFLDYASMITGLDPDTPQVL